MEMMQDSATARRDKRPIRAGLNACAKGLMTQRSNGRSLPVLRTFPHGA